MSTPPDAWSGRTVLVTGATEFLGAAVCRLLLDVGATVLGFVTPEATASGSGSGFRRTGQPSRFRLIRSHIADAYRLYTALAVHEVSDVFHLARATACEKAGSDSVEEDLLRVVGRYDRRTLVVTTRSVGELRIAPPSGDQRPGPRLGIARFDELFGPGDHRRRDALSRLLTDPAAPATGWPPATPGATAGVTRDFVFVHDAAWACLRLAESLRTEPLRTQDCPLDVTFRSGWEFTGDEFVHAIRAVAAGEAPPAPTPPPQPGRDPLGWCPRTDFVTALRATLAWYRNQDPGCPPRPANPPAPRRKVA